jgi:hypothetical protein
LIPQGTNGVSTTHKAENHRGCVASDRTIYASASLPPHSLQFVMLQMCDMWTEDQIVHETRWSRTYANESKTYRYFESKFLDGSVSITLEELTTEWPTWSDSQRLDFCNAIHCAPPDDSADIFRFLANDQAEHVRSMIASCVARLLPSEESVPLLANWAQAAAPGHRANYLQALSHTSDSRAHEILESHFADLLNHPQLMDDAEWYNDLAMDLVWCIKHLLEVGTPVGDLRSAYDKLAQHPCDRIRDQVGRWLADSFGDTP